HYLILESKLICFTLAVSCNKEEQKKKSKQTQALRLVKHLWQQVRQRQPSEISDLIRRPSPLLLVAAELGNTVFLTELVGSYPDLIWEADNDNRTIFHIAVLHRRESIFNLIYEIGSMKDLIVPYKDDNDNNMLHLAGRKAPLPQRNIVSGAALQMQRELLWFKEVEKIMLPTYRERKNKDGKTPRDLFTKEHKNLMKDGEKWMRGTAAQSMLVATLIATVVFAAAFTVPGGSNQDTGIPILLRKKSFMIFAVSDAIALFSSSTSILVFLSILTSRYAEDDFLESLPSRLMFGLITLFVSIISMMVTFTITFFLVFGHGFAWAPMLIAVSACVPVTLYFSLQYPLLADIFRSTYGSRFLFRPSKRMLY
ncbi:ankyrin repeat-containing protein NPR4-like, partial [Vitis riparia]|uniref:ankyrin repeat-containing protein NPR4-like n=1 Tax=Vitis riparia TaxID=96939 RepID=UPI00155AA1FC